MKLSTYRSLGGTDAAVAFRFVVLIGIVSLFADMTYEGARSINGSFLAFLGANALAVGAFSGLGELLGYLVRLASGYVAGRTQRYWLWSAVGYAVNLLAAPALALAGSWQIAVVLIVLERVGKGIRNPPRDVMLSNAGSLIGQGWAFALREALDQVGALAGPLIVAAILLARSTDFRDAYGWLLIPALLSFAVLGLSRLIFPSPSTLEKPRAAATADSALPRAFWLYLAAMSLMALGYADFNLVAFHLQQTGQPSGIIPLLYAVAMITAAVSAVVFGRSFDRWGLRSLAGAAALSVPFAPLAFSGSLAAAAAGVALWGVGLGIQDSLMSAPISMLVRADRRAYAFGVFNAAYGVAWFLGSSVLGLLYGHSLLALISFSVGGEIAALGVLLLAHGDFQLRTTS